MVKVGAVIHEGDQSLDVVVNPGAVIHDSKGEMICLPSNRLRLIIQSSCM